MHTIAALIAAVAVTASTALPAIAAPREDIRSENLTKLSSTLLCKDGQGDSTKGNRRHGGDLAFVGHLAVALCGNDDGDLRNDGFVLADIKDPVRPEKVGEFSCVASASDLAVYGHLVFLAVDRNMDAGFYGPYETGGGADPCEAELGHHNDPREAERIFKGFRIVDISNPKAPRLVTSVRANTAGAHNVTVLPQRGADGTVEELHVYASAPTDSGENTVVRVPLSAPELAAEAENKRTLVTTGAKGCHDISFFTPDDLAVCDALDQGSAIWEIPQVTFPGGDVEPSLLALAPPDNPTVRHHSSAFSHDGEVLVVSNESFATIGTGRCDGTSAAQGSRVGGGVFFFDISNVRGTRPGARVGPVVGYQPPQEAVTGAWCTAINLNVIPTRNGSDVAVVGWYAGGTTVIDFTDYARPRQMAHYIGSPRDERQATVSRGSYWYNGHIYVGNTHGCLGPGAGCFGGLDRGLDVLVLDDAPVSWRLTGFDFGRQECLFHANRQNPEHGQYSCPET